MSISITLTSTQVAAVVRDATEAEDLVGLFDWTSGLGDLSKALLQPLADDNDYSRCLVRALLILAEFPADGTQIALGDVASKLGYSASTTHRYIGTWVRVGALERDPDTRQYRRAVPGMPVG